MPKSPVALVYIYTATLSVTAGKTKTNNAFEVSPAVCVGGGGGWGGGGGYV